MNGFQAYKYYMAIKLHFTKDDFSVFVNRGHVRVKYESYLKRNDYQLFERAARQHDDREFIQYVAANFMYNNPDVIYDEQAGVENFQEFNRRKQSMTRIFENDVDLIVNEGYNLGNEPLTSSEIPGIVQLFLAGKVSVETMSILNDINQLLDNFTDNSLVNLMVGNDLRRARKAKGFVKYNKDRIMKVYNKYVEGV